MFLLLEKWTSCLTNNQVSGDLQYPDAQATSLKWWQWCLLELDFLRQFFFKHDDVIKWKHFPRYWPFVRGIHRSPVNSPHKGQWRGALMFTLICARINGWVNNCEAGDLRRYHAHYDVTIMHINGLTTLLSPHPLSQQQVPVQMEANTS